MKLSRVCRDERGTSAIEFAVTAPAFFLILFGIFEFGLLLWTQLGLQHGVERAARVASINKTLSVSEIQTYAAQQSFGLNPQPSIFTVDRTAQCGGQDGSLVSAKYPYQFFTLFVGQYFAQTTHEIEAQACFPR